jgi:fatty acid desaturase
MSNLALDGDTDYSNEFAKMRRHLVASDGTRFLDFVKTLEPNYMRVYRDIALGYGALALILAAVCVGQSLGISPIILVFFGSVAVGYFGVFLGSFIHEGAHFNLAKNRDRNDALCDALISWLLGLNIKSYRIVHFEHHRSLGTTRDSEFSYFSPLNIMFFLERMLGISTIATLVSYAKKANGKASAQTQAAPPKQRTTLKPILVAVATHGAIVLGLAWFGFIWAAASWVLGIGIMLPLFASVRQLLEHRTDDARSDIDYSKKDQGACTRLFGSGLLSSIYGSAGFNRHLLHHWEPQISYTRLADLESFLADTQMRAIMDRRRVTYSEAFVRFFSLY